MSLEGAGAVAGVGHRRIPWCRLGFYWVLYFPVFRKNVFVLFCFALFFQGILNLLHLFCSIFTTCKRKIKINVDIDQYKQILKESGQSTVC